MAWQVGINVYMEVMKKISNRLNYLQKYLDDQTNNRWVRQIVSGTLVSDRICLTLAQIKHIMKEYLTTLPPPPLN